MIENIITEKELSVVVEQLRNEQKEIVEQITKHLENLAQHISTLNEKVSTVENKKTQKP